MKFLSMSRIYLPAIIVFSIFLVGFLPPKSLRNKAVKPARNFTIFDVPIVQAQQSALYSSSAYLIGQENYEECEQMLRKWGHRFPQDPGVPYDLACIRSLRGQIEPAFHYLEKSIRLGFGNVEHIKRDDDLTNLREDPRFEKMLKMAEGTPESKPLVKVPEPVPAEASEGTVIMKAENLGYQGNYRIFLGVLEKENAGKGKPITNRKDTVGKLLQEWYEKGEAAGNAGDFYDNHDNGHSSMRYRDYPQLTKIEYAQPLKDRRLHYGLQNNMLFNAVVLGNSSTAHTSSPQWRSQARHGLTIPGGAALLALQYRSNHLYFYPEHKDYDPGHNREGKGGYGDVFPANNPYFIVSQGSSGSDRAFMDAVAATLSAFRPETKSALIKEGLLMPTVQMIFRRSNKIVKTSNDYFSGIAHPTVFQSTELDTEAMIKLANSIAPDEIPELPIIRVVEEMEDKPGVDYFDAVPRQRIFDSPQSICRFHRTVQQDYKITLEALPSSDDTKLKDLEYKWVILRGDCRLIEIENPSAQSTAISISWHDRRKIHPDSEMESNRVDIGLFIKSSSGKYWSAPAFFSINHPDNQIRKYADDGRILSIEYTSKNYTDPRIDTPAEWTDYYLYDEKCNNNLLGWKRERQGKETQKFTPKGLLVLKEDKEGKPLETKKVEYFHEEVQKGNFRIRQRPQESK